MNFVTLKYDSEGVGYGMSDIKKDYELPVQFQQVSPWAGRWGEYFKMHRQQAEQIVDNIERAVHESVEE
jgi:hypothetical protein